MALIFIDGFDDQAYSRKWISTLTAAPSFAETPRYGMGYCFKPGSSAGFMTKPFEPTPEIVCGFAFKVDSLSVAHILWSSTDDGGASYHQRVQVSTSGQVQAMRSTTVLASSATGLIVGGAWNYIEIRVTLADTGGIFQIRLNGQEVINYTGDTRNGGAATNFGSISLGLPTAVDAAVTYDDLYILDTTGTAPQNTFLGEVVVQTLLPSGEGEHSDFTPIGSPNNWENVDDVPPSTTDYNASSTVGAKDSYELSNLVGSVGMIFGIQENIIASKTGVGAANLKSLVRSGGADYTQPAVALGASPQWYGAIRETNPATSGAWTAMAVNSLEIGAEVA